AESARPASPGRPSTDLHRTRSSPGPVAATRAPRFGFSQNGAQGHSSGLDLPDAEAFLHSVRVHASRPHRAGSSHSVHLIRDPPQIRLRHLQIAIAWTARSRFDPSGRKITHAALGIPVEKHAAVGWAVAIHERARGAE